MTQTVVLAVGLSADAGEMMTVHNALETLTLRGTDHIHVLDVGEDVGDREGVSEFQLSLEVGLELGHLALGSGSCLFEMPHERRAGVLFGGFVIGKLYSGITIFLNCTQLRNDARTSLDDGARQVLAVGTENGSHSDFLSN